MFRSPSSPGESRPQSVLPPTPKASLVGGRRPWSSPKVILPTDVSATLKTDTCQMDAHIDTTVQMHS